MNKIKLLSAFILMLSSFGSCTKDVVEPKIIDQKIESSQKDYSVAFPFSNKEDLRSLNLERVVDFELARKIMILELKETGFMSDMNWNGCEFSELPVAIYDLKSTPRFYDYIVYDAEKIPIGTVRTYAKRDHSTMIEGVYSHTFKYNELLTKSSSTNPSLFIDWKGSQYIGVKSKAGEKPVDVISEEGVPVKQSEVQEFEGMGIVNHMAEKVLPDLVLPEDKKTEVFNKVPSSILEDKELLEEINISKNSTVQSMKDSMVLSLEKTQKEAEAYWNSLSEHEKDLLEASDDEITSDSKFFGRLFRRIFSRVDRSPHYIWKYDNNKRKYRRGGDCGPWLCGYLVHTNTGVDKYDYFEKRASTIGFGGFGYLFYKVAHFIDDDFGNPMYPSEMCLYTFIASDNKVWINPVPLFQDLCAYDQIKHYGNPAIRLCSSGGSLHWTLAYGTRQTGSWFWRNYYFIQIDNGAKVGIPGNPRSNNSYKKVDWWNPWLMVWD